MNLLMTAVLLQLCSIAEAQPQPKQQEPSNEQDICATRATWLNQLDRAEGSENVRVKISCYENKPCSAEAFAELSISECSEQLAERAFKLEFFPDCRPCKAVVARDQKHLDFLKWWLQNRRAKKEER